MPGTVHPTTASPKQNAVTRSPRDHGDATKVTVDYRYSVFFPVLFGTEIPLSSESKMRIE